MEGKKILKLNANWSIDSHNIIEGFWRRIGRIFPELVVRAPFFRLHSYKQTGDGGGERRGALVSVKGKSDWLNRSPTGPRERSRFAGARSIIPGRKREKRRGRESARKTRSGEIGDGKRPRRPKGDDGRTHCRHQQLDSSTKEEEFKRRKRSRSSQPLLLIKLIDDRSARLSIKCAAAVAAASPGECNSSPRQENRNDTWLNRGGEETNRINLSDFRHNSLQVVAGCSITANK